jgi:hypothetical protein
MGFTANILGKFLSGINGMLGGMDRRTVDTVRQLFFTFTVLLAIGGIFLGYGLGRKSAKRSGAQIAEYTNDVFAVDIKRERPDGDFRSMLESDLLQEMEKSRIGKIQFPVNERLLPEREERLVEPDTSERKVTAPPSMDLRDRISEADRIDERPPPSDVRALGRRGLETRSPEKPEIIKNDGIDVLPGKDSGPGNRGIEKAAGEPVPVPPRNEKGVRQKPRPEIKPLERKGGIIDK